MESQDKKEQESQLEEGYKTLLELESSPTFRKWRDDTEKAFMFEIEQAKANCFTLDEATLKALILYESKIKIFFEAFRTAQELKKQENIKN